MGGGTGTEGFFGGLLSGLGQGLLDRDAANYAKKLQDAKDRKALLTTILDDPNATWGQKATALQAFIPKPEQQGPVSKLLHRGKKPQPQQADPIEQLVQSYRALDAKSNPPAQGQASPAPAQAQTAPGSTPPLPQVGHPASATEPQSSTPPLPFPASPAALKTQQESQARIGEYQTESGITTQENVRQQKELLDAKLSQIDSLVKTGQLTPEEGQQARVEAITGHQLTRTTGTTLTGEEGQAVEDLLKQTNPATGKPYTRDEALAKVKQSVTAPVGGKAPTTKILLINGKPHVVGWDPTTQKFSIDFGEAPSSTGYPRTIPVNDPQGNTYAVDAIRALPSGGFSVSRITLPGGAIPPKPTASVLTQSQRAQMIQPQVQATIAEVNKIAGQLGPLKGRWNDFMAGRIGTANPQLADLQMRLQLFATALMLAHGLRGESYEKELQKYLNAAQSPENLVARIQGADSFLQDYAASTGHGTPTGPVPSVGRGTQPTRPTAPPKTADEYLKSIGAQ